MSSIKNTHVNKLYRIRDKRSATWQCKLIMSLSNEDIEIESGSQIHSQHTCESNELPELLRVLNVSLQNNIEKQHWELFSIWAATEADVANDEAEKIGEILNLSSVKIRYCPFCGHELI